jgi:U3 small nucleolar RNA-associated protein 13
MCKDTRQSRGQGQYSLSRPLSRADKQIWAIAVSSDEKTIVSAGADSVATFWQDSTEAEQDEKNEALIKSVQSEQDFTNYLSLKDYRRAIKLALAMSQPGRLLHLFTAVSAEPTSLTAITGSDEVDQVIATLTGTDLVRLLKFVRDWNTNARTSSIAQMILHTILKLRSPEDLLAAFENKAPEDLSTMDVDGEAEAGDQEEKPKSKDQQLSFKELLDGLIPYSQRHFTRIDKLVQDSYMLDYIVGEMDGGLFGSEVIDTDPVNGQGNGHVNGDVEMTL